MRKLKTLLILMFAASLSLTLFACGGGKKDKKEEAKTLNTLNGGTIVLDDTADETAWNARLETFELTGRNDDGTVKIKGSECDVVKDIDFGTPDRYIATFKPKENNANGLTAEVVVVINHAWGAADANGVQVCQHDGARLTPKDEDVVMHYGNFHYGTGANPALGNPPGMAAALPEIYLTAEEATALGSGFNKENGNGQVFNADAGITGKDSSGRIQPFGLDGRANKEVPTITAGDLTPGMSITIEGYARTDAGNNNDNPTGPWQVKNGNWNCPSYGIADPYSTLSKTSNEGGIDVGAAVIVRSEGWVLYNGIGQEAANLLGGLPAFIEGGGAYGVASGSTEASNCASWERATDKILEGQDVTNRPAYTSSDWKNWWVYSEGTDRHSLDSYGGQALPGEEGHTYVPVRVTWTYRTYGENDEIGIIVIESEYLESETVLRSYIKVPDPTRGSYRTIIHGDYSSLIITKSEYVEAETITDMRISETPQAGAKTQYLAGEQINAASVLKMEIKSEQNSAWHDGGIAVTNDMLYYYKGTGDYAAATEAIDTAADWEAVGDQPLTTAMKYFKVVLARGDSTRQAMVKENLFTIVENNVAGAVGDKYSDDLNSRDPLATYTRTIGGSGDEAYVGLAINKAVFRAVDTAKFASGITSSYSYATLRILGIADTFNNITEEKNSGTVGSDTFYYNLTKSGNDVLVAIAITKDMLGKEIVIDDLQDTPIHITFGTDSVGFDVTSKATYTPFALNEGGEVEITYTGIGSEGFQIFANYYGADMAANEIGRVWSSSITGASEGSPVNIGTDGIQVIGYETSGGDITITYKFPAFNFEKWTSMPFIRLTTSDTGKAAEDYIEYDFGFEATAGSSTAANHATDDVYFYEQNGTLYFVTLVDPATAGADIDPETDVAEKIGCTVNINNGNRDTARACNLTYIYEKGNIVFTSASYNTGAAYGIKNFVLNKAYGDYGLVVITSVNPAELGFTGDYGFQVKGASNYWKYNATDKSISYAEITATDITIVKAGDCYTPGIVAKEEKSGSTVTFLADYAEVGGKHVDEDEDNVCDNCGGAIDTTKSSPTGWWAGQVSFGAMQEGEIIDITGAYTSQDGENYEGYGITVDVSGQMHYVVNANGFFESRVWAGATSWDGESKGPKFDTSTIDPDAKALLSQTDLDNLDNGNENLTSTLITPTHPYNTINGYLNADGVELNGTSIGKVKTEGGQYRYTITYSGTTMTIRVRLYEKGEDIGIATPFYDFTVSIKNLSSSMAVVFNGSVNQETESKPITIVRSSLNRSVIESAKGEQVDTHAASGVTITQDGFDADRNAKLKVNGMASNEGDTHYLAFAVNFSKALPAGSEAKVVKTDGTAITGATAEFSTTTKLLVYVPVDDLQAFIIQLINDEGSTLQNNIYVDISSLAISNVKAEADVSALTLGETTFTIAYDGVEETDTLAIGEDSVALNAIGTDKALGGLTVNVTSQFNGGKITLSFKKPAADLAKAIPGYEIRIERAGKLIADNMITPSIKATTGDTQVGKDSTWYARANGTTLYLFGQSAGTADLKLNVNAGHATYVAAPELLGAIDLSFSIASGAVVFKAPGAMFSNISTVYTPDAQFTVFIIKLGDLGIEASTEYSFAIETDTETHTDKYYTVSSGAITDAGTLSAETVFTLQEHTAENDLITAFCAGGESAKGTAKYYGYVTVTGHTFPKEGGACTTDGGSCGQTGWKVENVVIGTIGSGSSGWSTSNADGYDPRDTEKFGAIVKGQKAVFEGVIRTATAEIGWFNMQGLRFQLGGLVMRCDGYCDAITNSVGTYDTNKWDINMQQLVEYDGTAYSGNSIPWADAVNYCRNNGMATITYDWTSDDIILITFFTQGAEHNFKIVAAITPSGTTHFAKDIYEIGLYPENGYFAGTLTVTGDAEKVPADQCNRPIRQVGESNPDPDYTADTAFDGAGLTIGTEGTAGAETGWAGYTNTPNWISKFEKGKKIVITGTQKAMATQPFWSSLTFFVWSTEVETMPSKVTAGDPGICMNHANGGAGHDETFDIAALEPVLTGEPSIAKLEDTETDFSRLLREVGADCNVTITFDWTKYNKQFSVTMKIEKDAKSVEKTYTFTEQSGAALAAYYNVGIGVDHSCATLTNITRTEGTPTADLPAAEVVTHDHAYTNGICTTCGAVQPVSQITDGEAVTASWTAAGFQVNQWNVQNFKQGAQVTVYGTQTTELALNWSTLNFEFNSGDNTKSASMRTDNYGWYFDDITVDGGHKLEDARKEMYIKTPNGTRHENSWGADYTAIMKQCDWRVDFKWEGDEVVITLAATCTAEGMYKDYTYYMIYKLDATGLTTATLQFGAENATISVVRKVATGMD